MPPFANEHSCRLASPKNFSQFRRGDRKSGGGKLYHVIYGKGSDGAMHEQALRYPKARWSAAEASAHCKSHKGSFEAAASEARRSGEELFVDLRCAGYGPEVSHDIVTHVYGGKVGSV